MPRLATAEPGHRPDIPQPRPKRIAPTQVREGNGLTGMRERLAAVGGTLTVEATPPRGLRLSARIPEDAGPATRVPAAARDGART